MAASSRTVFHVDMDAFFVSVEELFDPSLKGKPVVVGGQRDQRGVVAAASYATRKFGIHSAMPLRTAAKLCPQAIFVEGHPDRYRECSEKVPHVLSSFSPQIEMVSIDEAYLDMTGTDRLHGPPMMAADKLPQIEATLMRLSEMVGRRLRETKLHAPTLQLKLRYKDFTTITRARTLEAPTQLDNEIYHQIRQLFQANWRAGAEVRLLGVQAASFDSQPAQQS